MVWASSLFFGFVSNICFKFGNDGLAFLSSFFYKIPAPLNVDVASSPCYRNCSILPVCSCFECTHKILCRCASIARGRIFSDCGRLCRIHWTQGVGANFLKGFNKKALIYALLSFFFIINVLITWNIMLNRIIITEILWNSEDCWFLFAKEIYIIPCLFEWGPWENDRNFLSRSLFARNKKCRSLWCMHFAWTNCKLYVYKWTI